MKRPSFKVIENRFAAFEELMNVLTSYEKMFVNWYQSDCIKGEWRGI